MEQLIRLVFVLALAFILGFGIWYLIFWFLTNELDPFKWFWLTKVGYLILGLSSTGGFIEKIDG